MEKEENQTRDAMLKNLIDTHLNQCYEKHVLM